MSATAETTAAAAGLLKQAYNDEVNAMVKEEVELECNPIPLSSLDGHLDISVEGLELISWMIDLEK